MINPIELISNLPDDRPRPEDDETFFGDKSSNWPLENCLVITAGSDSDDFCSDDVDGGVTFPRVKTFPRPRPIKGKSGCPNSLMLML